MWVEYVKQIKLYILEWPIKGTWLHADFVAWAKTPTLSPPIRIEKTDDGDIEVVDSDRIRMDATLAVLM